MYSLILLLLFKPSDTWRILEYNEIAYYLKFFFIVILFIYLFTSISTVRAEVERAKYSEHYMPFN